MNQIVCMKWGAKYGAEYVNTLYRMVARHTRQPFVLHCFTDDAQGINSEVVCHDLPEMELPDGEPERGWRKLTTLQKGFGGLQGDVLFLDLDVVIVGNIDALFELKGEFFIVRDKKFKSNKVGNSSVYRFQVGALHEAYQRFIENPAAVKAEHRNEQAYLSAVALEKGVFAFWPDAWCPSFKYDCMKLWPVGLVVPPQLPVESKVVLFHGHPLPQEAIDGKTYKWYRPVLPTPWVAEHWQ